VTKDFISHLQGDPLDREAERRDAMSTDTPDIIDRKIVSAAHRYMAVVARLFDARNVPCLAERSPITDQECHEAFVELDSAGKALREAMQEIRLHDSVAALAGSENTDTPRTDSEALWPACNDDSDKRDPAGLYVYADFARQLERELAQARAELEEIHVKDSVKTREYNILVQENRALLAETDRLRAEVEAFLSAGRTLLEWDREHPAGRVYSTAEYANLEMKFSDVIDLFRPLCAAIDSAMQDRGS